MLISDAAVNLLLQKEDIEGLLAVGAPNDEYSSEADEIATVVSKLNPDQFNQDNIAAIISLLWMKSFELGELEIALRMPGINRVAKLIAQMK